MVNLDAENFKEHIIDIDGFAIVDFWAPWCHQCTAMAAILARVVEQHDVFVGKVDTTVEHALAEQYGVRSLPALFFFKNGALIGTLVGAVSEAKITALLGDML